MYCAYLARDPSNPSAVQPGSSGILATFLIIAVFLFSVTRLKIPKGKSDDVLQFNLNFACLFNISSINGTI